jgi:alpha-aminoadipic semialdehyde synthase
MTHYIGIRKEIKKGERRTPLTPAAVSQLKEKHDITVVVQPQTDRAYSQEEYEKAGALYQDNLSDCSVILGIKEMPEKIFEKSKAYICFHHVIKGQDYNMPMLKHLMTQQATMIDYECVVDENNRRLIFFGRHAGYAGMVDALHGLGLRLNEEGIDNPFTDIKQAKNYFDLDEAKAAVSALGKKIQAEGLPEEICPFVCGFLGYGNVSQGSQEIFDLLPFTEIEPSELEETISSSDDNSSKTLYKVVFKEKHMVDPNDPNQPFVLQDYYDHP